MTNAEKLQKYKEAREQLAWLPNNKIILWITEKDEWLKEYAKDITVRIIKDKFMPPNTEFVIGQKPVTPEPIDYTKLGFQEIEIKGVFNEEIEAPDHVINEYTNANNE